MGVQVLRMLHSEPAPRPHLNPKQRVVIPRVQSLIAFQVDKWV